MRRWEIHHLTPEVGSTKSACCQQQLYTYGENQLIWECRNKISAGYGEDFGSCTDSLTYDFGSVLAVTNEDSVDALMDKREGVTQYFSRR